MSKYVIKAVNLKDAIEIYKAVKEYERTKQCTITATSMKDAKNKIRQITSLVKTHKSVKNSKMSDAVSLRKGDWFMKRGDNSKLFKVIDDQEKEYNGFSPSYVVEEYSLDLNILYDKSSDEVDLDWKISSKHNRSFKLDKYTDIVVFGSAKDALKWLSRQLAIKKTSKDSIKDDYLGMVKINGRTWYVIHRKSVGIPEFWGITPDKWGDNPKKKFSSKADLDKYLKSVGAISDSIKDEANKKLK